MVSLNIVTLSFPTFPTVSLENKINVKLDGVQIDFNLTQNDNMVQLSFVYSLSQHRLSIALNETPTGDDIIVGDKELFLLDLIFGVGMILIIINKRRAWIWRS